MEENKLLEIQHKMAQILNDTPEMIKIEGLGFEVRSMRNGTKYLICERACKIGINDGAAFGDVMKAMAVNMPLIAEVLALAVLNNKRRIYADGDETKGFSEEYKAIYDTFLWEINDNSLATLLTEVLSKLVNDSNFFLTSSAIVKTMKEMMTKRNQPQNS